jgi:hypothetical protein
MNNVNYFKLVRCSKYIYTGAASEPWLGGDQVITFQNLITKRKQQFLQHKFKSSIFKIDKNMINMIYLI